MERDLSGSSPNKLEDLSQTPILRGLISVLRQDLADRATRLALLDYLINDAGVEKNRSEALIDTVQVRVWSRQQLRRDTHTGRRMRYEIYAAVGLGYRSKVRIVVVTGDDVEQMPQLVHVGPYYTHRTADGPRCQWPHPDNCRASPHVYHRARSRVIVGELALLEVMRAGPHTLIV